MLSLAFIGYWQSSWFQYFYWLARSLISFIEYCPVFHKYKKTTRTFELQEVSSSFAPRQCSNKFDIALGLSSVEHRWEAWRVLVLQRYDFYLSCARVEWRKVRIWRMFFKQLFGVWAFRGYSLSQRRAQPDGLVASPATTSPACFSLNSLFISASSFRP